MTNYKLLEDILTISSDHNLEYQEKISSILDRMKLYFHFDFAVIEAIYDNCSEYQYYYTEVAEINIEKEISYLKYCSKENIFVCNDIARLDIEESKNFITKAYIRMNLLARDEEYVISFIWKNVFDESLISDYIKLSKIISKTLLNIIIIEEKTTRSLMFENYIEDSLESANMCIWHYIASTGYVTISPNAPKIYGYDSSDNLLILEDHKKNIYKDDLALYEETQYNAINFGIPYDIEFRVKHQNSDEILYFRTICSVIKDKRGKVKELFGLAINMTEQKRSQARAEESHNLLNLVINAIPSPISVKNEKLDYIFFNSAFLEVVNIINNAKICNVNDLPLDKNIVKKRAECMMSLFSDYTSKDTVKYEHVADQEGKAFIINDVLFRGLNDEKYLVSVSQDITNIRKQETEIKNLYHFIKRVINAIPSPISVMDEDYNYIMANKKVFDILELDHSKELEEGELSEILINAHEKIHNDNLNAVIQYRLNAKNPKQTKYEYEDRIYLVYRALFTNNEGRIILINFGCDITEISQYEKELLETKNIAEHASNVKSEFISNISHEIRNPINAIIGSAELLKLSDLANTEDLDYLNIIEECSEKILIMINDLLDLAKIEAGKMTINSSNFNLYREIISIIQTFNVKIKNKDISIDLDYDLMSIPQTFFGDAAKIYQIITNFVSNAVKFTEEGQILIRVLMIDKTDNQVKLKISVKDSGIGIDDNKQYLIFEKFTQIYDEKSGNRAGTGLGLPICIKLAKLMGGEIKLNSKVNEGSEFSLIINLEPTSSNLLSSSENTTGKPVVLVVEDNQNNQMLILRMLEHLGFSVVICNHGIEALQILKEKEVNIILMDCNMPLMDGYSATLHIQEMIHNNEIKKIPIIGITAYATKQDKEKCLEVGMSDYLAKPFKINDLSEKINTWIMKEKVTS